MCIACEMQMFFAMEDLPPSTGTASHVDPRAHDAPRFVCEAEDVPPIAQQDMEERKPTVTKP